MPVERASNFCMRYIPAFWMPVSGSFVITMGSVTNGPPSPGQQVRMGRWSSSRSSRITFAWHGALFTFLGMIPAMSLSVKSRRTLSMIPCGGCTFTSVSIFRAISSKLAQLSARSMRGKLPKALMSSGNDDPVTFSNNSAGPPALLTRSAISVISRRGSTAAAMRRRSPAASSARMNSCRFVWGIDRSCRIG